MAHKLDLSGQVFGELTVISRNGSDKFGHSKWLCLCSCGKQKTFIGDNLKRGKSLSCNGTIHKAVSILGKRFGRLTVKALSGVDKHNQSEWICVCQCGVEKVINGNSLISGRTRSCGCYSKEVQLSLKTTHGQTHSPEYAAWQALKERCENTNNPGYPDYGGRGIKVFDAWRDSFEDFLEHVGKRPSQKHSIDRKNNDGNYEPGNVRWATKAQQNRNTRRNVFIEYDGINMVANDWAKLLSINIAVITRNMKKGMAFESIYNKYKHRIK